MIQKLTFLAAAWLGLGAMQAPMKARLLIGAGDLAALPKAAS